MKIKLHPKETYINRGHEMALKKEFLYNFLSLRKKKKIEKTKETSFKIKNNF